MKQVGKLWVVLALSALALVPARARAQQSGTTGTLSGALTDATTGQPVQSAQVNIVGTNVGVLSNGPAAFRRTLAPTAHAPATACAADGPVVNPVSRRA